MWWSKPKPEFAVTISLGKKQLKDIAEAEHAGRKAWRISVVNAMLAESYRNGPRRYRWSISELSQLSGVEIQTVSEHDAQLNNCR